MFIYFRVPIIVLNINFYAYSGQRKKYNKVIYIINFFHRIKSGTNDSSGSFGRQ